MPRRRQKIIRRCTCPNIPTFKNLQCSCTKTAMLRPKGPAREHTSMTTWRSKARLPRCPISPPPSLLLPSSLPSFFVANLLVSCCPFSPAFRPPSDRPTDRANKNRAPSTFCSSKTAAATSPVRWPKQCPGKSSIDLARPPKISFFDARSPNLGATSTFCNFVSEHNLSHPPGLVEGVLVGAWLVEPPCPSTRRHSGSCSCWTSR